MSDPFTGPVLYRLAAPVVARFLGLGLVCWALLLFVATAVVAIAGLPLDVVVLVAVLGVVGLGTAAWWLRSRAWVLRCSEAGYRVRLVRGAGTTEARWKDVEDAVTLTRHDVPCVVLRLRDGRSTTIPVGVLAIDREEFVHELQVHLQRGSGLRRL